MSHIDTVVAVGGLTGVGAFTLALLRFAYGAIRDAMRHKDDEIDRLHAEIDRLREAGK